jgi:hypothetical protein
MPSTSCPVCHGELWVCEEHPDKPWEHDDCGAAGLACVCNPHGAVAWREIIAEVPPVGPPH